ncbi:hypothetical protein OAV29_01500 [Candidatus Poseidoniaceae archaeon]|nr:hypothetical protein [Candidatus Poseidoniaceae archaeon]
MDTIVETPWGKDSDEEDVVETTASDEEIIESSEQDTIEEKEIHDVLALPIRAKPLFLNNDEEVVEFTLTESKDGLESTSIIVGEGLFRIVETKMHQDGVPRIDLKVALDSELTGFQHIVEKPTKVEMGVSGCLFFVGLILCLFPFQMTMILGISAILFGIKYAPTYLENHRLVFSSCGSTHVFDIDLIGVFKPTFRASMALIGPTLAGYMKTGEIDSTSIDELHASLRSPIPAPQPMQIAAPPQLNEQIPIGPPALVEIPVTSAAPMMETASSDMQASGQEVDTIPQPTQPVVIPAPPQATPQPTPLPPPPQVIPQPNPLPPPPPVIPQPTPLPMPMPPVILPAQPSMQGFDSASLPLDAPLPEAPRIPVAAAPQEQVVSQEITDALMDELSD